MKISDNPLKYAKCESVEIGEVMSQNIAKGLLKTSYPCASG